MRVILAVALLVVSYSVTAQNCQRIGDQTFCDNGVSAQQIGNSTFYSYPDARRAQQQGLPSSSQQIGNTRFYDNGVNRQSIGDTDFYSNGVTRQRIGDTDFYSNGRTCQTIGDQRFCN